MPPPSKEQQMEAICSQLHELSLRRQQLSDRLSLLAMLKGFRENAGFHEEGAKSNEKDEYEQIEEELDNLSEQKKTLQAKKDELERDNVHYTGAAFSPDALDCPDTPTSFGSQIYFVGKPPSFPAPQVILDVQKLPPRSTPTQCPDCQQFVTTEIITKTGNTTWLVCMVCTFIWEAAESEGELDLEDYTSAVLGYISKCVEDVTTTKTVTCYPNQKPWLNGEVRSLLKARDAAFRSGDAQELRRARRELTAGVKRAKAAYALKIQGHFSSQDPRSMWRGIKCITDYKTRDAQCSKDPSLPEGSQQKFYARFEDPDTTRPA
ncbi:hypothetical protein NFI96_000123 [Prochilodus magdalenae]|nr:hypothetical protein NFI96_000123 [Prochilodus magdalenae]